MVVELFFHAQSPPAQAVQMTLKELGIEYKLVEVDLLTGAHKLPDYLAINPLGRIPAMRDGDLCLGESRAIAIYLCEKYEPRNKKNQLYPTDIRQKARVNMSLFAGLDIFSDVDKYVNEGGVFSMTERVEKYIHRANSGLSSMEVLLGDNEYLAGNHMTLVDECLKSIFSLCILPATSQCAVSMDGVSSPKSTNGERKWRSCHTLKNARRRWSTSTL